MACADRSGRGVFLVAQLVVAVTGENDAAVTRVVRYFSYFTIQSNVLVCITTAMLAVRPDRDGPVFSVARLVAVICITGHCNCPLAVVAPAAGDPERDWLG